LLDELGIGVTAYGVLSRAGSRPDRCASIRSAVREQQMRMLDSER
jgi:hypothetical protein